MIPCFSASRGCLFLCLALPLLGLYGCGVQEKEADLPQPPLTHLVDPFIGTGAHGHTFPGAALPFGMVQLSPDTHTEGWDWCSGYHYSDSSLIGFSHTHLSGTGRGDLLDFLFMPFTGEVKLQPGTREDPDSGYRSRFSHEREKASPGYYAVDLLDYGIHAELTVTPRCGLHRYTFPEKDEASVLIDLFHGLATDSVVRTRIRVLDDSTLAGMRASRGWGEPGEKYFSDQTLYFVARFSAPFSSYGLYQDGQKLLGSAQAEGQDTKAWVHFESPDPLLVKVGISAVDLEGARRNLETELPHWDFDQVKKAAEARWEETLLSIEADLPSEADSRTFYTALYHAMLAPYLYQDVDGRYRGLDKKIHQSQAFTNYTVFSLWDTFRASHPLFTLLDPERVNDMIRSMLAHYEQYGLLPVWSLHGSETNCMIGYHAVPVIVDAYLKGIRDYDVELAYEALKTSAMQDDFGVASLKQHGYLPADLENKSVSKTLEYAFDDWCIAQMARELGKMEDYAYFMKRAKAYAEVFDPETRFMRGKTVAGEFLPGFDPTFASYGRSDFIEGNSWQYSWFVPHDVPGLIELMGGEAAFVAKLDSLFEAEATIDPDAPIDITGLIGQYAHGNEPSHHVAYLYSLAGQPRKTQERVAHIMRSQYHDGPEGLSGNEDCGQMSAWYVFSALGFYPVNPASGQYVFGTPLVKKAKLRLPGGQPLTIRTEGQPIEQPYLEKILLNGELITEPYLTHAQLLGGGELVYVLARK